jgi:hypothetical protein
MDADGYTFVFALEIEVATVSTIWRQPERCAEFLRVCDPLVHLTQPHLRIILEAVQIAYAELNAVDWATVVEVVRELGKFEEVGGLDGLNAVYSATEITPVIDPIFAHHVQMLKTYAEHRQMDPPRPVHWFSGGRGTVWRNKAKRGPQDPDYTGEAIVRGIHYGIRIKGRSDSDTLNFWLEPKARP